MGGSSSSQVTGYKYFANFLLFIGNPIEKLLNINFDKRGWIANERISYGSNGEMIYIEKPNLYGENEGGVYGTLRVKHGTNKQTACVQYKKYMETQGLPVSAYPYQSYILFDGGGFPNGAYGLTEEELESVGDELEENSSWYGGGFYLGNSGYMKEMLLWPKRIHVKNDGSEQWYDKKAEIREIIIDNSIDALTPMQPPQNVTMHYSMVLSAPWGDYSGTNPKYATYNNQDLSFKLGGVVISNLPDPKPSAELTATINLPVGRYKGVARLLSVDGGAFSMTGATQVPSTDGYEKYELDFYSYGDNPAFTCHISGANTDAVGIADITLQKFFSRYGSETGDINPIHKIREILTDDTAMNKPESDVNDANFMKAADCIYDEGLGISWSITEKSCIDAINELCSHIEAGVRVNRQTGLYEMVLFRDDWFEESEIHTLTENKIKSISFEVQNADEAINQLNVSYYDRENIKDASFSISENAAIKNANGFVNAENADFPYFMNQRNAAVVAQWKLKQYTTPCWKGTFTTGFYEARKWNRYDIVKINWSRKGIVNLPVRIMSINLGNGIDNTVSIEFVEVVPFSTELSSNVVVDNKIDTSPLPPQPAVFKAFELSYFEAVQSQGQKAVDDQLAYSPDIGYVAAFAKRPQNNSLSAQLYTDAGTGYEKASVIQYCETAQLDQAIDRTDSTFIVKNAGDIGSVRVGSQIFINDEIMVYQSFDSLTKTLTVKRGALDTVPQIHADDSVLFFADDYVAIDQTEYAYSEIVNTKAVTTTPSGIQDIDEVTAQAVEIQSRAIRPYPPANVKINDIFMPNYFEDDFVLTWANRNRSQQTGGVPLGYFDSSITLEENTQTLLTVIELDATDVELATHSVNVTASSSFTLLESAMQVDTRSLSINLKTVRADYECMNVFDHTVIRSTLVAPSNVTFEAIEY